MQRHGDKGANFIKRGNPIDVPDHCYAGDNEAIRASDWFGQLLQRLSINNKAQESNRKFRAVVGDIRPGKDVPVAVA